MSTMVGPHNEPSGLPASPSYDDILNAITPRVSVICLSSALATLCAISVPDTHSVVLAILLSAVAVAGVATSVLVTRNLCNKLVVMFADRFRVYRERITEQDAKIRALLPEPHIEN